MNTRWSTDFRALRPLLPRSEAGRVGREGGISDWSSDVCSSDLQFYLGKVLPPASVQEFLALPSKKTPMATCAASSCGLHGPRCALPRTGASRSLRSG